MQGGLSARRETHRFTPQQAQLLDYAPRNAAKPHGPPSAALTKAV